MRPAYLLVIATLLSATAYAADDHSGGNGKEMVKRIDIAIALANGSASNLSDVQTMDAMYGVGLINGITLGLSYQAAKHGADISCAPKKAPLKELSLFADNNPKATEMEGRYFLLYAITTLYPCLK